MLSAALCWILLGGRTNWFLLEIYQYFVNSVLSTVRLSENKEIAPAYIYRHLTNFLSVAKQPRKNLLEYAILGRCGFQN